MAGVFGVALGAAGLAGFIKSSITAFEEQQRVMTQTNAVIKSTGNAAGYTANQIADMAKEIQNSTPISDEAAQTGMNMLLTFTNIGHDVFPQVTQATLDMATAMNGGLTPSAETLAQTAIQVGKAMQDPILGVTALRRVGVNFNETQQAMIQKLVDTGKSMEAQKYILAELNKEFGGSASAQLDTYAGRLQRLKNQLNDTQEVIGGALTSALGYLMDSLSNAGDSVNYLSIPFQGLASIIIGVITLARQLGIALGTVFGTVSALFTYGVDAAKIVLKQGMADMVNEGTNAQTKLTQVWGTQTQRQTDISNKGFQQQAAGSSKKSAQVQKDLEKETEKFKLENEKRKADFEEKLADMIHAHQDKVKDLSDQIATENRDFAQSMGDRKENFDDRMTDMKDAHQQKVDDIVAQIAEETAKGELADQQKLADLNARLVQENQAYDAKVLKDTTREQEEIARLQRDHDQKVADTQKQLDEEKAILSAHQSEVDSIKDKAREDDITRLQRQYKEENEAATAEHGRRMAEIADRGNALGSTLGSNIDSALGAKGNDIKNTMAGIADTAGSQLVKGISEGATKAGNDMVSNFVNGIIDKAKSFISAATKSGFNLQNSMTNVVLELAKLPHFANGINNFAGGVALVGERGPELVTLPGGSSVTPNEKIGSSITVNVDMTNAIISDDFGAQRIAEKVGDSIIRKLQQNVRF
jgi:hypothetical protein